MTAAAPAPDTQPGGAGTALGRAGWHRRVALLPLTYLCGLVAVAVAHPVLPQWRWLAIHLLLLGAVTNAILIWSAHFTSAVLRTPVGGGRRGEAVRLGGLNAGVVMVLGAGAVRWPWVAVAGAGVVFAALTAHLGWLWRRLRAALPARFTVTVHFYLAATLALLTGIPVGAFMLVSDDRPRPRLLLFHAHINLLGWVTLTILGTVLTLWPTILRTRIADGAVAAARAALATAVAGLLVLAIGLLAWWPALAVTGVAFVAAAALITIRPAWSVARGKPPGSFAAWSIAAAAGWLLIALILDAATLATTDGPGPAADRFGVVLVPLLAGFAAQTLIGALAYLLPMAFGGGPVLVRRRTATLDRSWAQRVTMANTALAVFLLPVPPLVKITTSLLVLAALVQFLIPAVRLLVAARR